MTHDPDFGTPPPEFYEAMAKDCRCCPDCAQVPCDGVCAGGMCDEMCRCDDGDDYNPPEIVYLTTTWTCPYGHSESRTEDLGDPADHVRVAERLECGPWCKAEVGDDFCGKPCTVTRTEKREPL